MGQRVTYCCSPSIVWVKDARQILVMDKETRQTWTLRGIEAVVWDLLEVGYQYRKIIQMLSLIYSLPVAEARDSLGGVLQKWKIADIIRVSGGSNNG